MVKIFYYSGEKTGGSKRSESKAKVLGVGCLPGSNSFHRHSQKQWMFFYSFYLRV